MHQLAWFLMQRWVIIGCVKFRLVPIHLGKGGVASVRGLDWSEGISSAKKRRVLMDGAHRRGVLMVGLSMYA